MATLNLSSVLEHPARLGDPSALTVNFASPLADGDFEITARPVRTNRSTQHWSLELSQGGEVAATATAVFAQRRPTWSAPEAGPPPGRLRGRHRLRPRANSRRCASLRTVRPNTVNDAGRDKVRLGQCAPASPNGDFRASTSHSNPWSRSR